MVNNSVGGESVETVLTVTAPLSVDVEPKQQVVDYGRPATFKCNYEGNPVKAVYWMKNGSPLGHTETTLRIQSVTKDDRGMYQCFVRNDQVSFVVENLDSSDSVITLLLSFQESAQATAELQLGGRFDPPEFISTFDTQTVNPGDPFVSLKCVAKGDPAPEISWYVYGEEVKPDGVIKVGDFRERNGDVVSHLNISQVSQLIPV